jgi:hypothetical protein
MGFVEQIFWLLVLSVAVASVAWTVTQEEIFREPREFCKRRSERSRSFLERKFFYVFTCEYCFSHWVTLFFLLLTGYKLGVDDWRGYVLAFFVIPWIANQWMSIYRRLRVEIKYENALAENEKKEAKK